MDPKILELTRDDPRYAYEAYEFVRDAVTFTQERLGRTGTDTPAAGSGDEDLHVSGAELLRGACELAVREFGMMAPVVFRTWGIRTTDDFGEMVFRLINVDLLSKSDRDEPEDFHDVFDIDKTLSQGFELTFGDTSKRGDR